MSFAIVAESFKVCDQRSNTVDRTEDFILQFMHSNKMLFDIDNDGHSAKINFHSMKLNSTGFTLFIIARSRGMLKFFFVL